MGLQSVREHYRRALDLSAPLAAAVLAAAAFANALAAGFQFDDYADIVDNAMATPEGFLAAPLHTVRPLLKASYALNRALGGLQPWSWHAVNLALHVVATLLVFALARRAGRLLGWDAAMAGRIAFAATCLWAVHPALSETVTYVSGRSSGLSSVLVLAALLLATDRNGGWGRLAVAGLLAFLAPLARETALVLPALLFWWQATVAPREPWRAALRRQAPVWLGAVLAGAVIAAMPHHVELISYSMRNRPLLDSLRGNLYAAPEILSYLWRPWAVSIDPAAPRIYAWSDAATWLRLAGFAAAVAFAIGARRKYPLTAFTIGWVLLCIAPTNTVLWRADPVGLKPLYLASIAPALLGAAILARANKIARLPVGNIMAAIVVLALVWSTVERNALFASPVALWRDAAAKAPDKGRPHLNLALALLDAGRDNEAAAELAAALELAPWLAGSKPAQDAARRMRGAAPRD